MHTISNDNFADAKVHQLIGNVIHELIYSQKIFTDKILMQEKVDDFCQDINEINRFISAEFLAHVLAYNLAKLSSYTYPTEVFDADGICRYYKVRRVPTNHAGLVVHILAPCDQNNERVHILFRGTNFKQFSSVSRDAEWIPGFTSLMANKEIIFAELEDVLEQHLDHSIDRKVNLSISGHSLGGADTQNFTNLLIERLVSLYIERNNNNEEIKSVYNNISSINVNLINSAGVSIETAHKTDTNAKLLKYLGAEIDFTMNVILVAGDIVQQLGDAMIFSNMDPKLVDARLLKASDGYHYLDRKVALSSTSASALVSTPLAMVVGANFMRRSIRSHRTKIFGASRLDIDLLKFYRNSNILHREIIAKKLNNKIVNVFSFDNLSFKIEINKEDDFVSLIFGENEFAEFENYSKANALVELNSRSTLFTSIFGILFEISKQINNLNNELKPAKILTAFNLMKKSANQLEIEDITNQISISEECADEQHRLKPICV